MAPVAGHVSRTSRLCVLLAVASLLLTAPVVADGDAGASVAGLNPTDVDHGETTQTLHLGGQLPTNATHLTVDVSSLAEAGVDLSNASVVVERSTPGVRVDASLERAGDSTVVRATLDATEGPTGFRLALKLRGLETADADQAWLRYDGTVGDSRFESNRFRLEAAAMPDVGASVASDPLVVGRAAASQRLRVVVFDAPPETTVTITVDTAPLRRANVSLVALAADARVVEGNLTLEGVEPVEGGVRLRGTTGSGEFSAVRLDLSGLDTRGATPTEGLAYPVTIEAPAGSKTLDGEAFGVYRPGEAPTPTETVVESPTETPTETAQSASPSPESENAANETGAPSPGGTGGPTGFTAVAGLVAVLLAALLSSRRRE